MANFVYVPFLRWKKGEQDALRFLKEADRERMLPVADVVLLEASRKQPKLIAQMVKCAGEKYPIGVDLSDAYDGPVAHSDLADVCGQLMQANVKAWPVVRATAALIDLVGLAALKPFPAIVVRAREGVTFSELDAVLDGIRKACGKTKPIYLVVDMYAVGNVDPAVKAAAVQGMVAHFCSYPTLTQVVIAGGSFPMTLTGMKQGINNHLVRKELAIWQALRAVPECSSVVFGDYCVTNPEPLGDLDPTKINPSAAIRYALDTQWWVIRGAGTRSAGKGGMGQYNHLCDILINHPDYSGVGYSHGDDRYHFHAQVGSPPGNLMTWRRDATNHHLTLTVRTILSGAV